MSLNATQIEKNFDYIQKDCVVSVEYAGQTASGSVGMIDVEMNADTLGILNDYKRSVWINAADFSAEIKPNKKIKIDGEEFRIITFLADPFDVAIRIDCGALNG